VGHASRSRLTPCPIVSVNMLNLLELTLSGANYEVDTLWTTLDSKAIVNEYLVGQKG
jgi:hypothetical protein